MQDEIIWRLIGKKLSGEASDEELTELENLLRSNPDLAYPMQTIIDFWNPNFQDESREHELAFERHIKRMKQLNIDFTGKNPASGYDLVENISPLGNDRKFWNKKKNLLGLTLLILLVLGAAYQFTFKWHSTEITVDPFLTRKVNSEISTKNGSKTNVVLPDGSLVWLNAGSKLSYDKNYGVFIREINLTGEAFFDVVHNPEKPFVIHTYKMDIKVLGTKFNVKSYPTDKTSEATLIRGTIEVSMKDRPSQKIILKPNEKIVVANIEKKRFPESSALHPTSSNDALVAIKSLTYEAQSGDIVETSWVEHKLIFQDEQFKELADQMERWFGVMIRFEDPSKAQLRFTGSFKNETIQQALDALRFSAKFKYLIQNNEITIL